MGISIRYYLYFFNPRMTWTVSCHTMEEKKMDVGKNRLAQGSQPRPG